MFTIQLQIYTYKVRQGLEKGGKIILIFRKIKKRGIDYERFTSKTRDYPIFLVKFQNLTVSENFKTGLFVY